MLGSRDDSFWDELLKEADTNRDGVVYIWNFFTSYNAFFSL